MAHSFVRGKFRSTRRAAPFLARPGVRRRSLSAARSLSHPQQRLRQTVGALVLPRHAQPARYTRWQGLDLLPARRGIRFRRALVSQFHFLQIGEFPSSYHAIDPRTLRNTVKVSLCGLDLPNPEDTSLLRHWHSDDQDPPDKLICRICREICRKSLQSPLGHKQGQAI